MATFPPPQTTVPPLPPPNPQGPTSSITVPYRKGEQRRLVHHEPGILDLDWVAQNVHDLDATDLTTGRYARKDFKKNHPVTVHEVSSRKVNSKGTFPTDATDAIYTVIATAEIPRYVTQPGVPHIIPYQYLIKSNPTLDLHVGDHCYLATDYRPSGSQNMLKKDSMVTIQDIKRKTSLSIELMLGKSVSNDARITEVIARVVEFKDDDRVQYIIERQLVDAELK